MSSEHQAASMAVNTEIESHEDGHKDIEKIEATAETFAKVFLEDLTAKEIEKPDLSAFEQETLDLIITSKYDDLPEAETDHEPRKIEHSELPPLALAGSVLNSSQTFTQEEEEATSPVTKLIEEEQHSKEEKEEEEEEKHVEHRIDPVPEPAVCPARVEMSKHEEESHIDENNNKDKVETTKPPEPSMHQSEFHKESEQEEIFEVKTNTFTETNGHHQVENEDEEEGEGEDTFEEKLTLPPKQSSIDLDDELYELQFEKRGVAKNLWTSKRSQVKQAEDDDDKPTFDKFRTIRQNIKKGNTRSLKERFENFGKF